jgi:hypothetical protein
MSLAQNCALEAYALAKDVYVSECKICVKHLRLITENRLDITTCMKIVYEQLKVYEPVYVKPLAKQLIQCEKQALAERQARQSEANQSTRHNASAASAHTKSKETSTPAGGMSAAKRNQIISDYLTKPILTFDAVNQQRLSAGMRVLTPFTDDLITVYSETPEFKQWATEWKITAAHQTDSDEYENEHENDAEDETDPEDEDTSTGGLSLREANAGGINPYNQGLSEADFRQRQRAQAAEQRTPTDDPAKLITQDETKSPQL